MTVANLIPANSNLSAVASFGAEVLSDALGFEVDVYVWSDEWSLVLDGGVTSRIHELRGDVNAVSSDVSEAIVVEHQGESHAIIPFDADGRFLAVATGTGCSVELLRRLARLSQQILRLKLADTEPATRRSENVLVDQNPRVLESIVQQLSGISPENSISEVAGVVLPSLSSAINAQSIAVVPESTSSRKAFVSIGDYVGDLAEWARIVESNCQSNSELPAYHRSNGVAYSSIRNFVIAPIRMGERIFGWLVADIDDESDNRSANEELTSSLMSASATILATYAFADERLEQKEQLLLDVVRSLVSAIDAKDPDTCGHSIRVAIYASLVAEGLELTQRECEEVYLAGLLHDVGKIGVPESIFHKTSSLTEEEFDLVKQHPDHGWKILHRLEGLQHILPGVVHHHESYDGTGYPDQIAGEDIPLAARILATVDAYDALTSERPYRKGKSHNEAMAILDEGAGIQWDPIVVETIHEVASRMERISRKYRRVAHPWRIPGGIAPQEGQAESTTESTSETTSRYDAFGIDRI